MTARWILVAFTTLAGCADLLGADFDRETPSPEPGASGQGESDGSSDTATEGDTASFDARRGDAGQACSDGFEICTSGCCPRVTQVTAGLEHTCARLADGSVWCWGGNGSGQLGDGTIADRASPTKVSGLESVSAVAASATGTFTCALASGDVYCWGDNTSGQLGDGTTTQRLVPTKANVAGGVQSISVGGMHVCAMFGGGVACWGDNYFGQLGVETGSCRSGSSSSARRPCQASSPTSLPNLDGVSMIGAGYDTTGVIASVDGGTGFLTWGGWGNANCRVSDGSPYPCFALMPKALAGDPVVASFALGGSHGCFLPNLPGGVRCWGDDDVGQLGGNTGAVGIVPVLGVSDAVALAAGQRHTCAQRVDGTVLCWGANDVGQTGLGASSTKSPPSPVPGLTEVIALAAGSRHSCALSRDRTLRCWGANAKGQLGSPAAAQCGTTPCTPSPVALSGL